MKAPRILLAAGSSGSGKTLLTSGILTAFKNRGLRVNAFKCGPDYIDPMFHKTVIGTPSRNLDTFFSGEEMTRYLLSKHADCDIAVMEGVMGFYDGLGGISTKASAYDLARTTGTPVILLVNGKGMSVSMAAFVKGFLEYKPDAQIRGVILNRVSPMLYPRMKKMLEAELPVRVLGYVPPLEEGLLESRHLGLIMPSEIPQLEEKLKDLAEVLEKSLDLEGILELAGEAPDLEAPETIFERFPAEVQKALSFRTSRKMRIGIARDEAFCFFYEDSLDLLQEMGAELVPFSPLMDAHLPEGLDGLLLNGGYPELHARALSENVSMRREIKEALESGLPCMAECGGFMYLLEAMEDMDQVSYPMCGYLSGRAVRTKKLTRFGYVELQKKGEDPFGGKIPAHEFHYFDTTANGDAFYASKPLSSRGWDCMHMQDRVLAGFPHLYYYGKPQVPVWFLKKCEEAAQNRRNV